MKALLFSSSCLFTVLLLNSCTQLSQGNLPQDGTILEGDQRTEPMTQGGRTNTANVNTNTGGKVQPKAPGRRVFSVAINSPYVALTFDDGPHATHTPRILNILNKYGAKATFYVLGERADRHPSIVGRIVNEGHEVGVHTWDHPSLTKVSRTEVISQMDRSLAAIAKGTSKKPRTMRPPYGAVNKSLADLFAQNYGMTTILWNVDTNDWRRPGVSVVTNHAVNNAKNGSIILLHDIHSSSADAVEGIVKGLQARGFKIVTVSELLYRAYLESQQAKQATAAAALPTVSTTAPDAPTAPITPSSIHQNALTPAVVPTAPAPATAPAATLPTVDTQSTLF